MGMMLEVLPPGMEHAEKPDLRAEVFGVAGKLEERSGTGAEEQVIEQTLVLQDESGELVGQGEDDVEVRHGQQLGLRGKRCSFDSRHFFTRLWSWHGTCGERRQTPGQYPDRR